MKEPTPTLEEQADALLEEWARSQAEGNDDPGDVLRKAGILNRRRLGLVHSREIPLSRFRARDEVEDYD